jgi:RNA polymerase sigma factor (sigma-70 family)
VTAQADELLRDLAGLRALARALAGGDADDLLQDTAVDTLEHPPAADRPRRPWLVAVLRNRWRMGRRGDARRRAREQAVAPADAAQADDRDPIDRARVLERLGAALVGLDEPFRATVIARYLDGRSAADIARSLNIPAGTVRWRLKEGLARLRAALDGDAPRVRWIALLVPAKGVVLVSSKAKLSVAIVALVLLLVVGVKLALRGGGDERTPARDEPTTAATARGGKRAPTAAAPSKIAIAPRAVVEAAPSASLSGRVVNWSTGDPVAGAELTFVGASGAQSIHSDGDGNFELAVPPGRYALASLHAPSFLPYAPEFGHGPFRATLAADRAVRGVVLFLYPALDYHGRVIDARGAPVGGATIRLVGAMDQVAESEWTSDRDGGFTFHAGDGAVFEASEGARRGWGILDGRVAISHRLDIAIGDAAARDATIIGRVIDRDGTPIGDALVRATPAGVTTPGAAPRAGARATTASDGTFRLAALDREAYDVTAESDGSAPGLARAIAGGARDVELVLDAGLPIGGRVETAHGEPVPSFAVLAFRRSGVMRELVAARTIVEPSGRFELRVASGSYEIVASALGWAPSHASNVATGTSDLRMVVRAGATARGVVRANDGTPLPYARVTREALGGGDVVQPANAGTVTRADGSFELPGIPEGKVTLSTAAGGFHQRIDGPLDARDGGAIGPLAIELSPLAPGEQPGTDLVGIGVQLAPDGDALRVDRVVANSGAAAAGIIVGDRVTGVDGVGVVELGLDGAIAHIRGAPNTTVAIALARGVTLTVERRRIRG